MARFYLVQKSHLMRLSLDNYVFVCRLYGYSSLIGRKNERALQKFILTSVLILKVILPVRVTMAYISHRINSMSNFYCEPSQIKLFKISK